MIKAIRQSRWRPIRWQPRSSLIFIGLAAIVGLLGGVGVWAFKRLIDLTSWTFSQATSGKWLPASLGALLVPMLGGLIVGLIVHFFIGEERHHGVAGIIEATALAGGRLRYRRTPLKALAAALSIGSGASVGPEDPSVQIGANLGSMFGQLLRLSEERTRSLVAAGAGAGIAAAFNAPIAGVFFALEIILGEISGSALGAVVVASVVSSVFTQAVSGIQPAFKVPAYAFKSAWELPMYLLLGLLAGPIAATYTKLIYFSQDVFQSWRIPKWLKPVSAGLILGAVGLILPQILGVGYSTIEKILGGQEMGFWLLIALLAAKLVMTPLSIGGGFIGGVFAPSLFIGATLGAAFGYAADHIAPALALDPPAFAMVGMAAVLAGTVHSPLTAILLLFEMTNDYRIILPLMFAVAVSLLISQQIQHESVYLLGLKRKGIHLEYGRDVDVLQAIQVGEVMQTQFLTLSESQSISDAAKLMLESRHHGLPVLNEAGELRGILTIQDIDRAQNENPNATVGEFCTRQLVVCHPDESLAEALRRMSVQDLGRLPVVARENPREIVGMLRRADIIHAYDLALARRETLRHQALQVRLGAITPEGVRVIELTVEPGSPCDGRKMNEIPWPHNCLISTVRRGRRMMIPHGDTLLAAGDILVAVTESDAIQDVAVLCSRPSTK